MKKKLLFLPLCLLTLSMAACQPVSEEGKSEPAAAESEPAGESQVKATFDAFTLDQLHEARASKGLANLDKKYVSIKGKVTFNKRTADDEATLFIQSGKNAVEVNYDKNYQVNAGDVVEIKGQFVFTPEGEVGTIFLSSYTSVNADYDIKVINEAIEVETVTITKEADFYEYNGSKAKIDFTVTGNRTNAAFVGKLSNGDDGIIVAPKLNIAEKFDAGSFNVDDFVRYEGVFTYSADNSAKVFRYLDKAGFSKAS